jgi:putative transposase
VERFGHPVAGSVPTIVRSFKSATTRRINQLRGTPGGALWQRGYLERVIRDAADLQRIRRYIVENPSRWGTGCDEG